MISIFFLLSRMLRLAFLYSQPYFRVRYGWEGRSRLIETVTQFFVANYKSTYFNFYDTAFNQKN
ncbi:hypothetical protein CDL62_04725 [Alkalitalea saponilacus]|nr:hypothetical protein CDL62_04725 [Alkalitalea saponilacus]